MNRNVLVYTLEPNNADLNMYQINVASLCFPSSPICLVLLLNLHNNFSGTMKDINKSCKSTSGFMATQNLNVYSSVLTQFR